MKFQVLSSGSKGNMTYIETSSTKLILDAGISLKEIARRSDIDLNHIDGILITHAHIDHTSNLIPLLNKTKAVLYINKDTLEEIENKNHWNFDGVRVQYIDNNKKYLIGDIAIFTMELSHDCANCNGFIFASNNYSLAYIADTGLLPLIYMEIVKKVNSLIIEANHDITMLNESNRPWYLKNRILSCKGHLSNVTCGEIINRLLEFKKINNIILAHLSEECNNEKVAIDTVYSLIEGEYIPNIQVALQRESLPLMEIIGNKENEN